MNNIFTNAIEVNSFMGLVTDNQKKSRPALFRRQSYAKVESKEILRNMTIATVLIIAGLTMGTISQQKMEFSQYSTPMIEAAV
ncbi:hypothetical protein MNBD_ALPHA02-1489 [hydrothermal vent metagenome]|uniref:Uncharacterized protein n=1 Tax=hydrothermal vent metagenome TaxID=652676 RepID=A0A3B0S3H7_9ZZZZ